MTVYDRVMDWFRIFRRKSVEERIAGKLQAQSFPVDDQVRAQVRALARAQVRAQVRAQGYLPHHEFSAHSLAMRRCVSRAVFRVQPHVDLTYLEGRDD